MATCSKCERELLDDESGLCPACKSTNDRKKKTWVEIAGGVLMLVITAVIVGMSGGKGKGGGSA